MAPTMREQPRCIDALNFTNRSVGLAGWKATFRFALRVDDFDEIGYSRFAENQTRLGAIDIGPVVVVSLAIRSVPRTLWDALRPCEKSRANQSSLILIDLPWLLPRGLRRRCLAHSQLVAASTLRMLDRQHLSRAMRLRYGVGSRDECSVYSSTHVSMDRRLAPRCVWRFPSRI